jgi:hypothetical protein
LGQLTKRLENLNSTDKIDNASRKVSIMHLLSFVYFYFGKAKPYSRRWATILRHDCRSDKPEERTHAMEKKSTKKITQR